MRISDEGINFIKGFEELRLKAYLCPAGVPTIGYGHTADVSMDDEITTTVAEQLLECDLSEAEDAIDHFVDVELTQNQYDALVSFVFNVGISAFRTSTLLKLLNAGEYSAASNQFARWNKSNGKVLPGLVRRRADEAKMFRGEA